MTMPADGTPPHSGLPTVATKTSPAELPIADQGKSRDLDAIRSELNIIRSNLEKEKIDSIGFLQKTLNRLTLLFVLLYAFGLFITALVGSGNVTINFGGKPTTNMNSLPKPPPAPGQPPSTGQTGAIQPNSPTMLAALSDFAPPIGRPSHWGDPQWAQNSDPGRGAAPVPQATTSASASPEPAKAENPNATFVKDIMLPLLGALIVWIVAATGLERLKTYDLQFSLSRKETRELLAEERNRIAAEAEKNRTDAISIRKETTESMRDFQEAFNKKLESLAQREDRLEELERKLEEKENELENRITTIENDQDTAIADAINTINARSESSVQAQIASAEDRLKIIVADATAETKKIADRFPSIRDKAIGEQVSKHGISSVGQLHSLIQKMEHDETKTQDMIGLVDLALADKHVTGAAVDYFNISAVLGRSDQESLALKVCETGLSHFPNDVDLLAHALQFASKLGDFQKAADFYRRARKIGAKVYLADTEVEELKTDFTQWNWRMFVFSEDYLETIGQWEKAVKLAKIHVHHRPREEDGYAQLVGLYSKRDKALELERVVKAVENAKIRAPKVYMQLARDAQEGGENDKAILFTSRGLMASAEVQPSVSQSALWFYRAAAFDAKFIEALTEGPVKGQPRSEFVERITDLYRKSVNAYRSSSRLLGVQLPYRRQAEERVKIMKSLLVEHGIAVPQDDSENDQDNKLEKLAALAELFKNAKQQHGEPEQGQEQDSSD